MKRFLRWPFLDELRKKGLGPNPEFPESQGLVFLPHNDLSLSWEVEEDAADSLLLLRSATTAARHAGTWFVFRIECEDVIAFDSSEEQALISVLFGYTLFSPAVGENLYAVPESARCLLRLSPRRELHASFSDRKEYASYRLMMEEAGFSTFGSSGYEQHRHG